mmetsp:Transcript_37722/g.45897  ORF Transcript_37722/g.45897 Transcript_37722/m.45897 type:complete len:83 (+) Transcript_37722:535-783(+)
MCTQVTEGFYSPSNQESTEIEAHSEIVDTFVDEVVNQFESQPTPMNQVNSSFAEINPTTAPKENYGDSETQCKIVSSRNSVH